LSAAFAATLVVGAVTGAQGAGAAPVTDTSALTEAVTAEGVFEHMQEFQDIADANGGTREASTPGYTASADYVAELMEQAGYTVTRQEFLYNYFEELAPATLAGTSAGFPYTYLEGTDIATMGLLGHRILLGCRAGGRRRRAAAGGPGGRDVELGLRGRGLRGLHRGHRADPAWDVRLLGQRSRTRSQRELRP
jgi:hypothetical protein